MRRVRLVGLRAFGRLPRRARAWVLRWTGAVAALGAVVVVERDRSLLLVRHAYRQGWGFPGGSLRRGEDPVTAVVRELEEELGVTVQVGPGAVVHDLEVARVTFVYRASILVGEPTCRSLEVVDVGWFDRTRLPELEDEAVEVLAALEEPAVVPRVTGVRRFR